MKKYLSKLVLASLVMLPVGCARNVTAPPAPLITGANSQFDQNAYQTLVTAHAFVTSVKGNSAKLTPTEKTTFNQLIVDLNAADVLYKAFHTAGAPVAQQAQMQAAVDKVSTDQQQAINSGVK